MNENQQLIPVVLKLRKQLLAADSNFQRLITTDFIADIETIEKIVSIVAEYTARAVFLTKFNYEGPFGIPKEDVDLITEYLVQGFTNTDLASEKIIWQCCQIILTNHPEEINFHRVYRNAFFSIIEKLHTRGE